MFSLRRFPIRSCKVSSLIPAGQISQVPIASRANLIVPTTSSNAALPSSVTSLVQRRNFGEDGQGRPPYGGGQSYGGGPSYGGGQPYGGPSYGGGMGGGFNRPDRMFESTHRGPDGRPLKPTNVLYVGNLQFDVTEDMLRSHFEPLGEIKGARIVSDVQGMSKGFGYIEFSDLNVAIRACEEMHNSVFAGRRLNVQYLAKPANNRMSPNPPSKTLFIGNMNYEMSDDDINKLFKDIQNCLDVRVAMDRRTGQPRGFAHADFSTVEAAMKAKEQLEGKEFFGRTLRVDYSARQRDEQGNLVSGNDGTRQM